MVKFFLCAKDPIVMAKDGNPSKLIIAQESLTVDHLGKALTINHLQRGLTTAHLGQGLANSSLGTQSGSNDQPAATPPSPPPQKK